MIKKIHLDPALFTTHSFPRRFFKKLRKRLRCSWVSDSHLSAVVRYFWGSQTDRMSAPNQRIVNFNCDRSLFSGLVQRMSAFSPSIVTFLWHLFALPLHTCLHASSAYSVRGPPPATRLGRAFNDWTPGGACRF